MLPRLQAGESVRASTETSIGTNIQFEQPSRVLNGWERNADPDRRARKATARDLADLPIDVVRVPVKIPRET